MAGFARTLPGPALLCKFCHGPPSLALPQGRTQGAEGPALPPLGPEKHYIFRVSFVKLRDLHLLSLFLKIFAMWED